MKSMPLFAQPVIYNNGLYNQVKGPDDTAEYSTQTIKDKSTAQGINANFMEPYNVLTSLSYMTKINKSSDNTFLFMVNDATHEPMLLKAPEYEPSNKVDNKKYDTENTDRFNVNGITLKAENETQMSHYHANIAAFLQLGKWFDYLRENNVYDNTRIILVSDHGQSVGQIDELIMDDGSSYYKDVEFYYPLLMVKDFGSKGFKTSREFMTNADVPTLATNGLIENPKNPFTGKLINSDEKTAHDQYIVMSYDWDVNKNNGETFLPCRWASVKEDMWKKENWNFYSGSSVLKEHAAPN